jgi:hypothetical protein
MGIKRTRRENLSTTVKIASKPSEEVGSYTTKSMEM